MTDHDDEPDDDPLNERAQFAYEARLERLRRCSCTPVSDTPCRSCDGEYDEEDDRG